MSVFKNYESGEPTCRLYVKNIPKQVEERVGVFAKHFPMFFFSAFFFYLQFSEASLAPPGGPYT